MSTRDYKHKVPTHGKRERPRTTRNQPRRWPWFAAGFACGLLVAFLAYLKQYSPETLRLVASQSALRDEAQRQPKTADPDNGKPRFEFYTLLPEMEVAVPEGELQAAAAERKRTQAPAETPTASTPSTSPAAPAPAASTGTTYMMQVASFKTLHDADRLKASLALIGLVASIQTVSVNGEATYFRVRVGPYTDITRLEEARAKLREQNFEPLVLKVRG